MRPAADDPSRPGPANDPGPGAAVRTVDARGLRCPLPVIRLAAAARSLPAGTRLTVWCTDPAAEHDVPAWARMRGHRMVDATGVGTAPEDDDGRSAAPYQALTVELGPGPATA